ncbi:MAG: hypothetical protein IAI49_14135, partial [Candidatus Eremiobacteraeota bacterium]|nr:hypothetical protein [Candidatus Eremiobacteraeota bacterium]
SSHEAATAAFETSIGRKLAVDMHYTGWTSAFPTSDETADARVGRLPLVSWNCGDTNANVTAGKDDAAIDAFAAGIEGFGKPVMLRWLWEMNLRDGTRPQCYDSSYDPPNGFDAAHFVAAWQHIHARFVADGVTNVIWVWCPGASAMSIAATFYPGSKYVDWVGADTYDRTNAGAAATIDAAYPYLTQYGKPAVIAENGEHAAVDGGNQPLYFSQLDGVLRARPVIGAYLYFDSNVRPGDDWLLDPAGVSAFAAFAKGPYESLP